MAARAADAPRVRVGALIRIDGQVLLVRHRRDDARYHLLPGGGVDPGETLEAALVREVAEETGLDIEVERPVVLSDLVDPLAHRHVVNITFTARVIGGAIDTSRDERIEAVDLVAPHELKGLDLRPPMADAVAAVVSDWENAPARYLGPLFTPEKG